MMVTAEYMHVCVILGKWRPAGRKIRVATVAHYNHVSGEAIAKFSNEVSRRQRFPTRGVVRLHVEARRKHPMSCCMREPTGTAQSLGDDAHAVVKRPKHEHGLHTKCGLFVSVG